MHEVRKGAEPPAAAGTRVWSQGQSREGWLNLNKVARTGLRGIAKKFTLVSWRCKPESQSRQRNIGVDSNAALSSLSTAVRRSLRGRGSGKPPLRTPTAHIRQSGLEPQHCPAL